MPLIVTPPPFKVQLFINADTLTGSVGYSEVYWHLGATIGEILTAITDVSTGLLAKRQALLPPQARIVFARVSDGVLPRRVAIADLRSAPLDGTFVDLSLPQGASEEIYHPDAALLLKQRTDTFLWVNRWLRAVPYSVVNPPDGLLLSTVWDTAISEFTSYLEASTMLVYKDPANPAGPAAEAAVADVVVGPLARRKGGRPFGLLSGRQSSPTP